MAITRRTDRVLPLRKLIHLAGAAFPLLYIVAPRQVVLLAAAICLAFVVVIEWGRRHWQTLERLFEWLIGPALREGEERGPTTGTWSMLGIIITVLAFKREIAIPAMFYAHLGDPAAEVAGRNWGRHRIASGKSLEGSLGCFFICVAIGLACTRILPLSAVVAVVGALTATIADAMPLPKGDNLWMAPLSALAMTVADLVGL
jgi:glycerol-3-phosphate acyltransferase PlsY